MHTSLPAYSVLMSVYVKDNAEFFKTAINSMLTQTILPAEFVLVCDGPLNADLDAIIENYLNDDRGVPFNCIRLPQNMGLGLALRAGLVECKYDYIARMDSDDIARPWRCEFLLGRMIEEDLDLVGGAIEEFDNNPGDMSSIREVPLTQSKIEEYSKSRNPFNHMTVMFRKSAVLAAGSYLDFPYLEDYYLWVRMIINGCKCANIKEVVVDVRVGNGMYGRRSNMKYLKAQASFFETLVSIGYISRYEALRTMVARTLATILPAKMVKALYSALLRG